MNSFARFTQQSNAFSTFKLLPATAAIEYVAACCRTRTRTRMKTGMKTKIGTITKTVLGAYARSPQVQCIYEPSRLSVPSILAWRTNIQKRETRPRSSAGSWPPLPKFSGYVEVDAPDIFRPSTIWVRPLFTELGPKNPHFAKKQTNICRLSGDINNLLSWFDKHIYSGLTSELVSSVRKVKHVSRTTQKYKLLLVS